LQCEKILSAAAPCLLNVRVVTFSSLFRVLTDSAEGLRVLDKTSAVLFMWKAIQDVRGELKYFARSVNQYAFGEKMFNTINQLTSCMADFRTLERNATADVTKQKMHDIALIQARYRELTAKFTDGAGVLDWLIENVAANSVVRDAHFYVTGFPYLSVQRAEVVRRLAAAGRSFTIGVQEQSELAGWWNEVAFAL
jgi:ATP-dependent helicase/DNAse subunit B